MLRLASGGVLEPAERDHLHGIPPLVNDPHFNPVIRQNIEKKVIPMPKLIWREPIETTVITSRRDDDTPRSDAAARHRRWGSPQGGMPAQPRSRVTTLGDIAGRESGALVVLLVAVGGLTLASDEFLTGNNLANLARQVVDLRHPGDRPALGDPDRRYRPVGRVDPGPVRGDHRPVARRRLAPSRSPCSSVSRWAPSWASSTVCW